MVLVEARRMSQALPLKTLGDNGKPPSSRIKTADDARLIVSKVVEAGKERSHWNATIKGQIDGNPPFNPHKLRENGQAWRTNVNFMETKSAVSNALTPYYDLFAGARYFATFATYYGTADERQELSDIVTEEFDCMLKKYKGFHFNTRQMLYDLVVFNKGFLVWEDDKDWAFKCKQQHRVYVPDGTDAHSENADVIVIRERMRVHKLWKYIKDRKTASDAGWNPDQVVAAIRNAQPEIAEGTNFNYEFLQQQIKDRDIVEGVRCSTVPMAYVLVREMDDTVTLYIVEEKGATRTAKDKYLSIDFLYEKKNYAKEMNQFIATFFLETAEGSWNSSAGLGRDIFSLMALKDRIKCSAMDLVFLRTGITLQAKTEDAHSKAGLIQMGGLNIIPPQFEVQQATIMGDVESPFYADRYLDNTVASNTGVYRSQVDKPKGNPRTLGEVELQFQINATLSNSAVNSFYLNLDAMYEEIFRRATLPNQPKSRTGKLAEEFQKRCKDRGVPREAMEKVEYVRAYRNSGNGSIYMRQQNMAQMVEAGILDRLPESGKEHWIEDFISLLHGQSMVARYSPSSEKKKLPNDHEAYALLENAALKIGAPVTWTPTQNNLIHAQTHLQAGAQASQSLEQGTNPAEVAGFLDAIGKHTAVHLGELAKDPSRKGALKQLEQDFKQLASVHDQLVEQIQSDAEAQQEQQAAQQQRAQQMDGDFALDRMALEHKLAMAEKKTDFGIQDKARKTQAGIMMKDASTAANISLSAAKARASTKKNGSEK